MHELGKNIVYLRLSTVCALGNPLGVLEYIPRKWEGKG
jgi:hypothetical protein